jgi:hypothetical protein
MIPDKAFPLERKWLCVSHIVVPAQNPKELNQRMSHFMQRASYLRSCITVHHERMVQNTQSYETFQGTLGSKAPSYPLETHTTLWHRARKLDFRRPINHSKSSNFKQTNPTSLETHHGLLSFGLISLWLRRVASSKDRPAGSRA